MAICATCGTAFTKKPGSQQHCSVGCRYWPKVDKREPDECWPWQGAVSRHGYGKFSIGRKEYAASNMAYRLARGDVPAGMLVCHSCDNRACCNPSHLFLGTFADNNGDARRKDRTAFGERNSRAKLTSSEVVAIRERVHRGDAKADVAREYGVDKTLIGRICAGQAWVRAGGPITPIGAPHVWR